MVYNSEQIKAIIPHRYPFLLIDRIDEAGENEHQKAYMIGRKNVTTNEPFFQGHFPESQVMPGVLIIEALAQVGVVSMLSKPEHQGKLVYFTGIDKAKFRKKVVPGDTLILRVDMLTERSFQGKVFGSGKAVATVDGKLASEAEISFVVAEPE